MRIKITILTALLLLVVLTAHSKAKYVFGSSEFLKDHVFV